MELTFEWDEEKINVSTEREDLHPEYNLASMKGGVRGKYQSLPPVRAALRRKSAFVSAMA
jgi:hypothetical protein